jgi:DNA-binding CsgD family transcriptional regulator
LIDALLEAGDIRAAQDALAQSGFETAIPEIWQFLTLWVSRGRLRLAQGDAQSALDDMLTAQEIGGRYGIANPALAPCGSIAALALARLGRGAEARDVVAAELAVARRFGAPGTLGIVLCAAGLIEGADAGIQNLREAVANLARSPAQLQHARALAELGAALRRAGARREAQEHLRQALDLADRCGGKAVADQARAELVITGARPRRRRIAGVESLTPSERRVAELAAQGMTNRQIAQSLFVSHPTVVTHLSHCYQKLDIRSRDQLSGALATGAD